MIREIFVLFIATSFTADFAAATTVLECSTGKVNRNPKAVSISKCDQPPCLLKRKTTIDVEQHFVPDRDVHSLKTSVNAAVLGVSLPFVGVDGSNACNQIYNVDGSKASCPLTKGTEYVYKNSFPVLQIYPRIAVKVHWALTEGPDNIACFEVPAQIM
ncbi:NPC intracellular cholesterol transporter 2 homolog a-like [Diprion similis]|uniref:NPC intracellular cholesterol transporter 2 homolog a-like n=1 Tax=Diprion similis TaxID=362088 RepID=UPI001EF83DA8|nr:NPC intracellular cholesterol transporter 2 homolog a-like [Diprion similis]